MKIHPILTKCGKYSGNFLPTENLSGIPRYTIICTSDLSWEKHRTIFKSKVFSVERLWTSRLARAAIWQLSDDPYHTEFMSRCMVGSLLCVVSKSGRYRNKFLKKTRLAALVSKSIKILCSSIENQNHKDVWYFGLTFFWV